MSWLSALSSTYDACIEYEDYTTGSNPLIPICHTTNLTPIEITVDLDGNFLGADIVSKDNQNTIMPCTEESAGRTSGLAAYPLCDKLEYLAPDISERTCEKEGPDGKRKTVRCGFDLYIEKISCWAESQFGLPKIDAVRKYVSKGTILDDLIKVGILCSDDSGKLVTKSEMGDSALITQAKISGEQSGMFVRWRVDIPGDPIKNTWQDKNLQESWIKYQTSLDGETNLCYATGEYTTMATNHPAKIRNGGDKAKLISSDNKNDFTYKGRFESPEQACGIGLITTQKAHCMLRWLISRQGYHEGDLCIVTWCETGAKVPDPFDTDYTIFGSDDSNPPILSPIVSERINNRLKGYDSKIITDRVHIIALDSATTGRMSILMYREYIGSDYLERLNKWYTSLEWHHSFGFKKNDEGKSIYFSFYGAPCPRDIAKSAFGENADDKIIRNTIERLIPCIMESGKVPKDIVDCAVRRASNPVIFEGPFKHDKAVSIACSLYKNWSGGKYEMTLEENRNSRDYLYGRLLAIADILESSVLIKQNENRQTTASRLMQRFSEFPFSIWRTIELSLAPYKARLNAQSALYYEKKIQSIMALFEADDFTNNSKLTGEFLLGYHCQKEDHFKRKEEENEENEE